MSAVPVLSTDVLSYPSNSTPVPGGMPPIYIDAIRDVLLFTLQSQLAPMLCSMDGLSHQFASLYTNVHNEVKAVSQKVDSLESCLERTNSRLVCLQISDDTQSSNLNQFTRD